MSIAQVLRRRLAEYTSTLDPRDELLESVRRSLQNRGVKWEGLTGSVARGTALPSKDAPSLVALVSQDQGEAPRRHVDALFQVVQASYPSATVLKLKGSVQLEFADGTLLELVPSRPLQVAELIEVLQGESWVKVAPPAKQRQEFQIAGRAIGADLTELVRLAKFVIRRHGGRPSPEHVDAIALQPFELQGDDLLTQTASFFLHLASAVTDPLADPFAPQRSFGEDWSPEARSQVSLTLRAIADGLSTVHAREAGGFEADATYLAHYLFGELVPVPQGTPPRSLVVLNLDGYAGPASWETHPLLHQSASKEILYLSEFGAPSLHPQVDLTEADWVSLGAATHKLVDRAQSLSTPDAAPVQFVVVGHAPLALFVMVGSELGPWSGPQTVLQSTREGHWHQIKASAVPNPDVPPFFDVVRGLGRAEPSSASGYVAVFVSCMGHTAAPLSQIRASLEEVGEELAGVVEVRTSGPRILEETTGATAANELLEVFRKIPVVYPKAAGVAIMVAGPAALAFLVGRAANPKQLGAILVARYQAGAYRIPLRLPWRQETTEEKLRVELESLDLHGFRGFSTIELLLHPQLTVLFGINGSGKTSILDAIAIMLSQFADSLVHSEKRQRFVLEDIQLERAELEVTLHLQLDGEAESWSARRRRDEQRQSPHPLSQRLRQRLSALSARLGEGEPLGLPVLVYYSVNRASFDIPSRTRRNTDDRASRVYRDALLKGEASFRAFFAWFKEQEDAENAELRKNRSYRDKRLSAVRSAIEGMLPGFRNPHIERSPLRMVVTKNGSTLSITQLSDGERSVLALAGDLARRLCDANPSSHAPLHECAVVLIDELELHLHPGWQRLVVERLMTTFRGAQFIVTTHSPQVLGHVEGNQLRRLALGADGIVLEQVRGTYGLDANLILREAMEIPERLEHVSHRFEVLHAAIDQGDLNEAERLRSELSDLLGEDYPELAKVDMRLYRARRLRG